MLTILWTTLGILVALYVAMMFWNPPQRREDPVPNIGRYPSGSAPGDPGSEGMYVAAPGEIAPGTPDAEAADDR